MSLSVTTLSTKKYESYIKNELDCVKQVNYVYVKNKMKFLNAIIIFVWSSWIEIKTFISR